MMGAKEKMTKNWAAWIEELGCPLLASIFLCCKKVNQGRDFRGMIWNGVCIFIGRIHFMSVQTNRVISSKDITVRVITCIHLNCFVEFNLTQLHTLQQMIALLLISVQIYFLLAKQHTNNIYICWHAIHIECSLQGWSCMRGAPKVIELPLMCKLWDSLH